MEMFSKMFAVKIRSISALVAHVLDKKKHNLAKKVQESFIT